MLDWRKKIEQGKKRLAAGLDKAGDLMEDAGEMIGDAKDKAAKTAGTIAESATEYKDKLTAKGEVVWEIFEGTAAECKETLNALEAADDDFELVDTCSIGADKMAMTLKLKG